MMSWGFPFKHVVLSFSSVSQVSFIILGSKPPYLCRVSQESPYQIGGELTSPREKKAIFYTPRFQTEVGGHIVYFIIIDLI